jgi:broad-specificity NMP kinase
MNNDQIIITAKLSRLIELSAIIVLQAKEFVLAAA